MTKQILRGNIEAKNVSEYEGNTTTTIQHLIKQKTKDGGSKMELVTVYIDGIIEANEGDTVEYQVSVSSTKNSKALYYNALTVPQKVK